MRSVSLALLLVLTVLTSSVTSSEFPEIQNTLFKPSSVVFRTRCKMACSQMCLPVLGVCDRYNKCVCLNNYRIV